MSIRLVRIDDRLIHGQVVVGWVKKIGAECIVVCDDEVYSDALQRELMRIAVPDEVNLFILSVEDTYKKIKEGFFEKFCTILLLSSPFTLLRLVNMGVSFSSINIGGIREKEERKMLFPQVFLNEEEAMALLSLAKKGTRLFVQIAPFEKPKDIEKKLKDVFGI